MQMMAVLPPAMMPAGFNPYAGTSNQESSDWDQGELIHLIPIANHDQILLKTSFAEPLLQTPRLRIIDRNIEGRQCDTRGYFWEFYAKGLDANKVYELKLLSATGKALCGSWPLKTFPHPEEQVNRCRVLAFTCAGGNEDVASADGTHFFLPLLARQRLLERGLSFNPDIVTINGDHIYWDQVTSRNKPAPFAEAWQKIFDEVGVLDKTRAVLGTDNEVILKRIVDPQIARLYGVRLRSTPTYMLTDDHDLFENDEAMDEYITLPPTEHNLEAARATQHLYYPEFLSDPNRPDSLPGSSAGDRLPGLSEVVGTIRYGTLLEALLYDTKRYVSLDQDRAGMVPESVEDWLRARTASEETSHLFHMPSTPIGWSAGKWAEWYPDILEEDGSLGTSRPKPYWPSGWWKQNQRLLEALSGQHKRPPVIAGGDLHILSAGKILKSGELDLSHNPVNTFCVGPLGSAGPGFPSKFRGTPAQVPSQLEVEELLKPFEKNGFTIIDVTPEKMTFHMFAWRPPEPLGVIDTMEPVVAFDVSKPL